MWYVVRILYRNLRAILIYLCTFFLREPGEIFPQRRRELLSEMTPKPKKAIGQDLQDLQDYRKSATGEQRAAGTAL
jgi:hypothetical protein